MQRPERRWGWAAVGLDPEEAEGAGVEPGESGGRCRRGVGVWRECSGGRWGGWVVVGEQLWAEEEAGAVEGRCRDGWLRVGGVCVQGGGVRGGGAGVGGAQLGGGRKDRARGGPCNEDGAGGSGGREMARQLRWGTARKVYGVALNCPNGIDFYSLTQYLARFSFDSFYKRLGSI